MKKSKMWHILSYVLIMSMLTGIFASNIPVSAYNADETNIHEEIQQIIDNSIGWINQSKADDGSFGDNAIINDTCYGIEALLYENCDVANSLIWLEKFDVSENSDILSRKLIATKNASYADALVKLQNDDGGFGLNDNYSSDIFDSSLVLEALVLQNNKNYNDTIINIINYLFNQQNNDGGWGYSDLNSSELNITLRIVTSIKVFMKNNNLASEDIDSCIDLAKSYLSAICEDDCSESCFEVFMLNNILKLQCDELDNAKEIVDKIKSTQSGSGSFYNSIYKTNLVVRYLNNLLLSGISPMVTDLKVNLDKTKLYLNKHSIVKGTYLVSYDTPVNKECKLITTIKNDEKIILNQTKTLMLLSTDTQLKGEAFSLDIIPEKIGSMEITTELFYGNDLIKTYSNSISVVDSEIFADVLLIQDAPPWRSNAAELVLNNLAIPYDKMTAQEAKETDLSIYKMIYVSNDQNTNFYNIMFEIKSKLDDFVYNGGTLIYGVCDSGWAAGISEKIVPGDVMIKEVHYSNYNYITDVTHPIVTAELSDGVPLTNNDLYNNYASHRYFDVSTFPLNTKVILDAGEDMPTLIEYPIGKGVVIGSTLTWEHSYSNASNRFGRKALDDLFLYAYNIVFADEEFSFTSDIYTNKDTYSSNEDVNIYLNCGVSAYQCRANGVLEIRDKEGNLVEKISDILAIVYSDKPWSGSYQWNTDKYISGDYEVCIEWYSNKEELLSSSKCSISIMPDNSVVNNVSVDKETYKANEEICVTDIINNDSTNTYFNNLLVEVIISDGSENNEVILTKTSSLLPESEYTFSDYVKASELGLGNYLVTSTIKSGKDVLSVSQTSFKIEDYTDQKEKYMGSISVSKNSDKDQMFDFSVKNVGNFDSKNLTLKAVVFNDSGEELGYLEKKLDLSKNEKKSFSDLYNTEALAIGNYSVVLILTTENQDEIILDTSGFQIKVINKYNVTFVNDNGEVLSTQMVEYGQSAKAPESPVKENTAQYSYKFNSWDTDFSCVTSNMIVTAVYDTEINKYTVTFVDEDGTVLNTQKVEYGSSAIAPSEPSKESSNGNNYIFVGWDTDFSCVTSDMTITAIYKSEVKKYTVKFVNDDGTVLDTQEIEHGKPAIAPTSVSKENSKEYTYTFAGWDTDFSCVTSDMTITAIYKSEVKKYTVKFVNDDGTVLDTQEIEHGKPAIAPTSVSKENSKEYTYTFARWDKDFSCVTSDMTVTAIYESIKINVSEPTSPTNKPTEPPTTSTEPVTVPATSPQPVANNNSEKKQSVATGFNSSSVVVCLTMLLISGCIILNNRRNKRKNNY